MKLNATKINTEIRADNDPKMAEKHIHYVIELLSTWGTFVYQISIN